MSSPTDPSPASAPSEGEELGFALPAPARMSRGAVVAGLVVAIGGVFAFGFLRHRGRAEVVAGELAVPEQRVVRVETVAPKVLASDRALALPGTVKALEETQIYARVSGYVRSWKVDLGDKVAAGQLLAELDTPEIDAQIAQARAQLAQAKAAVAQAIAQRDYSKSNTQRYETLANQQLVSKAQVEQTQAQSATDEALVAAAQSNVLAQEANVRRLLDTASFAKVSAPFAGTITARTIDRGALVRDSATTSMFTLVATDPIRVFVDVPQTIAPSVARETPVAVTVREYAGVTFPGKVTRAANALDPELHTMVTEIQVPNPDGKLLPGMYVQAAITLPVPHRVVELPATALYNDAGGLRVATVDRAGIVKYVKIGVERDTGATVQVASGLTGDEQVIKTAVPSLLDGDKVEVLAAPAK